MTATPSTRDAGLPDHGRSHSLTESGPANRASAAARGGTRLRDRLTAVRKAIAKQVLVVERPEDIDVIGLAEDELEAAVQVFYVRRGRVVGCIGRAIWRGGCRLSMSSISVATTIR